ncbi:Zinc finger MYND domain-containing 19 Q7TSV3 [Chlorella sorokiniana]|uniref:Zinc finger MYND domain-containing 19 Q7TSV3 n=1 Tax=Chlorella sorokiniana TaxID=3076 RepID=A0A2P6TR79_CHLSO|nr:Zinc finger MYND domain-containing 19 Q7TSV3 [Chlorella sorokiniana]|eukprot:PRW56574.1 Zinc finger MYND domain-containing 19 Q7TSV3 [Chlorella sorokiniana]
MAPCRFVAQCVPLAAFIGLSDQETAQLAAVLQLALLPCPPAVSGALAVQHAQALAGAAQLAAGAAQLAARRYSQLLAQLADKLEGAPLAMPVELVVWYGPQLSAAAALVGLVGGASGPRTAAVAASIASPSALLPWLRSVTHALNALPTKVDSPSGLAAAPLLVQYQGCLRVLLSQPCWSSHAAAIAADPALQAAIVGVLLQRALPALAAAVSVKGTAMLLQLIASSQLDADVRQLLQQPDASNRAAAALHRVLAALPDQQPAGMDSFELAELWMSVTALAVSLMAKVQPRRPAAADGRRAGGLDSSRAVCTIADGARSGGSGSHDSGGSGSSRGSHSALVSIGGSDGSIGMARAAAWGQVAAQALRKLAAALPHLTSGAGGQAVYPALAAACLNTRTMVETWGKMAGLPVTVGISAVWVEVCAAGLRLQPLLSQLEGEMRQQQLGSLEEAPQLLSTALWALLADGTKPQPEELQGEAAQEAAAVSLPQLLQLHSLACQVCHSLAGSSGEPAINGISTKFGWYCMQFALDKLFEAAFSVCVLSRDEPLVANRPDQALCVAHLAATQAVEAAAARAPAAEGCTGRSVEAVECLLWSLFSIAGVCPSTAAGAFRQAAKLALASLAQEPADPSNLAELLTWLADQSSPNPPLACSLVSAGLLTMALKCADRLAASGGGCATEKAGALLRSLTSCLEGLTGEQDKQELIGSSAARTLAGQAAAAQSRLREQLAALPADAAPAERAQQLRQLLPATDQLAAADDAYCQLPSQQAALRLELARAAVPRSCAYLRCSNVQAEGAALMCKGDKGLRCSACHVVWYCGTACSHADWREGSHHRVCKPLGEERRRRKAAQALASEE